jgi:dolichol-phosphate mannosyltransferase
MPTNFAVVTPLANESRDFEPFVHAVSAVFNRLGSGVCYLVIDQASKDNTLELSQELSRRDPRFVTIWAPENRNVVQAYMVGYRAAFNAGHEFVIEMDAGLSHDPAAIPLFLNTLKGGSQCVYGCRFMPGGSTSDSSSKRSILSRSGTLLAWLLLGLRLRDATSGFQGFHRSIVEKLLNYKLLSEAHFFHVELRHLLRKYSWVEIPIHYRAPSPSVSSKVVSNSLKVLKHYFVLRLKRQSPEIL